MLWCVHVQELTSVKTLDTPCLSLTDADFVQIGPRQISLRLLMTEFAVARSMRASRDQAMIRGLVFVELLDAC